MINVVLVLTLWALLLVQDLSVNFNHVKDSTHRDQITCIKKNSGIYALTLYSQHDSSLTKGL